MSSGFKATADALERDRFVRAQRMTIEQRLLHGAQLFDYACEASLAGFRTRWPDATDSELQERLGQMLTRARERETVAS